MRFQICIATEVGAYARLVRQVQLAGIFAAPGVSRFALALSTPETIRGTKKLGILGVTRSSLTRLTTYSMRYIPGSWRPFAARIGPSSSYTTGPIGLRLPHFTIALKWRENEALLAQGTQNGKKNTLRAHDATSRSPVQSFIARDFYRCSCFALLYLALPMSSCHVMFFKDCFTDSTDSSEKPLRSTS